MNALCHSRPNGLLSRLCAAAFLFACAGLGNAAVVYSGIRDAAIPANDSGVYVNPLTGVTTTALPADANTGTWMNLFFGGTAIGTTISIEPVIMSLATGNGDGLVRRFDEADQIGTGLFYASGMNGSENHTGNAPGQFQANLPGYLGFRMILEGETHYGWIRITVNDLGSGVLHDWAFESSDNEMIVVPECSVPLLALFAAIPLALIRRRTA
jgi:hypothetical protein